MARSRSVAVAQTRPVRGDVPANVDEHVRLARLAAAEGAQVVVFPELSLTGYELDLAEGLAFAEDDPRLAPLLDLASARGKILVVGAPVRVGPLLHIGAFVLGPDRTTRLYTKRRLGAFPASAACDSLDGSAPPAEASVFRPGDHDPLVRFGGDTAVIAVCADIGEPDEVVLEERWASGDWFRSGMVWSVGKGRVFYFRPGHETYAVFKEKPVLQLLENAVRWLAPKAE